jgi:hypothetical protein
MRLIKLAAEKKNHQKCAERNLDPARSTPAVR